MKKLFISLLIIYSMFLLGCPKGEKTYRRAKEASATVQVYSLKLIQANIDVFKAGEISLETKDKIAGLTGKLVGGIRIYRNALAQNENSLKDGNALDGNALATLNRIFDMQVIPPFLSILSEVNLLSGDKAELIKTIITSLRVAILTISDAFAQGKIYAVEENRLWA